MSLYMVVGSALKCGPFTLVAGFKTENTALRVGCQSPTKLHAWPRQLGHHSKYKDLPNTKLAKA
jgi:hypothetical protein